LTDVLLLLGEDLHLIVTVGQHRHREDVAGSALGCAQRICDDGQTGFFGHALQLEDLNKQRQAAEAVMLEEAIGEEASRALEPRLRDLILVDTESRDVASCGLVFSALDADTAAEREPELAAAGCLVVSNARAHRLSPLVPLVVPEVNPGHLDRLAPTGGAIVCNPNCAAIGIALAVKPLADAFGLEALHAVTQQAISGAGLKGVQGGEIEGNVIPHIAHEESQIEAELPRLLGEPGRNARCPISTTATRVPVRDGHLASVSVRLGRDVDVGDVQEAWRGFRGEPQLRQLPSAPDPPLHVLEDDHHPQPVLHRDADRGMAASVGRLRRCPVLGWKFVTLSHNVVRGAAGGSILLAELVLARRGYST